MLAWKMRKRLKKELGPKNCLYPMPTVLVGAMVNGKPNFITIAHVGIADFSSISLSMGKNHYTNAGIKESGVFSVNIPSVDLVKKVDYVGITSGRKTDKSGMFDIFYGKLGNAPLISECPINMECKLIHTIDFPQHDLFVGQIVDTYCDEACLTDGEVDYTKVQPILLIMNGKGYWKLGERFASAWNVGWELK